MRRNIFFIIKEADGHRLFFENVKPVTNKTLYDEEMAQTFYIFI